MAIEREIIESPVEQGADEEVAYSLTTTPWGGTPTSVSVKLYEGTERTDRTATMLSGSASVASDVITTPTVTGLTVDKQYRLEIKFTEASGNVVEPYLIINCEY